MTGKFWKGLIFVPFLFLVQPAGGASAAPKYEKATFAGGCFWCMEHPFEKEEGVVDVMAGYTGGEKRDPTYKEVSSGTTGHYEAVEVTFDPSKISYEKVLDIFWRQVDPTDAGGQFADRGPQYRTAVFYHNEKQRKLAEESKKKLQDSGKFREDIVTEIKPAVEFYKAEDYHQDYYKTCPVPYKMYRAGSGRDRFLKEAWKNG